MSFEPVDLGVIDGAIPIANGSIALTVAPAHATTAGIGMIQIVANAYTWTTGKGFNIGDLANDFKAHGRPWQDVIIAQDASMYARSRLPGGNSLADGFY